MSETSINKNLSCPCLHTTPCDPNCTCVKPYSSRGCNRCCSYGSEEQQKSKAEFLSKKIDGKIETTTVVNIHHGVPYTDYIGRGSWFGNPFAMDSNNPREEVIKKYKKYFYDRIDTDEEFKSRVLKLKGKTLACFCKPKACHGDVIVEYLETV